MLLWSSYLCQNTSLCFVLQKILISLYFFFIIEANNLIKLNYTHNDVKLKERRFFVSNFDSDFDLMVFFDSTVRYGESPWGRGRQGACIRVLTLHWRVCSSPGCYNTPRLRWCAPNSPAVPVSHSNSTPSLIVLTIFLKSYKIYVYCGFIWY